MFWVHLADEKYLERVAFAAREISVPEHGARSTGCWIARGSQGMLLRARFPVWVLA